MAALPYFVDCQVLDCIQVSAAFSKISSHFAVDDIVKIFQ